MQDRFDEIIHTTLAHEGGYVNDPKDPGGETRFGISKRSYPDVDIKALTRAEAIDIYRRDFWVRPKINLIQNDVLAAKVFDIGVNTGCLRSVMCLQTAANYFGAGLNVDGLLGPLSLGFVNGFKHQAALLEAFKICAGNYYFSLNKPHYVAGWLNRLAA